MNSKKRNPIILLAVLLFCACSPALYLPTMTDAAKTGVSADSLMIGRTLYVDHCGSCHNVHLPEQYTSKHWIKEMSEMKQKAKVSDQEAKLILNFILARSKSE
jgi:hypothetical protein